MQKVEAQELLEKLTKQAEEAKAVAFICIVHGNEFSWRRINMGAGAATDYLTIARENQLAEVKK